MTDNVKHKTLILLVLATIVTALLAAALPQLELKPGMPLPHWEGQSEQLPKEDAPPSAIISINTFMKAFLAVVIALSLARLIYNILKGSSWKNILRDLLVIVGLALLASFVFCILFALANYRITPEPLAMDILPPDLAVAGPPLGPLPQGLLWLVWAGLAVGLILLAVWISIRQARQTPDGDLLQLEMELALQALRAGSDFKNVIVRCYQQMSVTLQKEQGIELAEAMTAREFERLLEARGLPQAPVHRLTRLFEAARYGYRQPNPSDEQIAFDCLNAIVQSSREEPRPQ